MAPTALNNKHIIAALCLLSALTFPVNFSVASQDVLPHPCDLVKCPPMAEITCPEDSDIRETIQPLALLHATTAAPADDSLSASAYNSTEIADDLFAQCCLGKKCICKTCHIPDCHQENEVVVELLPESMETPGHCCGHYECHKEPNCSEVRDTENYWLADCQRCKCYSGERLCHQSCDEGMKKETAICNSKKLNTFFQHGESWKDGCYECECVNGEEKCVMPFCRSVNCPPHRQVYLAGEQDSCCPICWPKDIPMPNGNGDFDDEDNMAAESGNNIYDDEEEEESLEPIHSHDLENEVDPLPNIKFEGDEKINATTTTTTPAISTTSTTTTTKSSTTTSAPQTSTVSPQTTPTTTTKTSATANMYEAVTTAPPPPCMRHEAPATYQVYPEVVEVVRQSPQNGLLYGVIIFLAVLLVVMVAWNIQLRAKQRSYRPVSNIDDNFNKMSCNIKKMNDYA